MISVMPNSLPEQLHSGSPLLTRNSTYKFRENSSGAAPESGSLASYSQEGCWRAAAARSCNTPFCPGTAEPAPMLAPV